MHACSPDKEDTIRGDAAELYARQRPGMPRTDDRQLTLIRLLGHPADRLGQALFLDLLQNADESDNWDRYKGCMNETTEHNRAINMP